MLSEVGVSEFAKPKESSFGFRLRAPDGSTASVSLYLWHLRRRVILVQFDLSPNDWSIRQDALEGFLVEYRKYWEKHFSDVPKGGVSVPGRRGVFCFSIRREDLGAWIYKAAQIICDRRNLRQDDLRQDGSRPALACGPALDRLASKR